MVCKSENLRETAGVEAEVGGESWTRIQLEKRCAPVMSLVMAQEAVGVKHQRKQQYSKVQSASTLRVVVHGMGS